MSHVENKELIQTLHECVAACNHCFDACLKEDDVKTMANCIKTDRECADICAFFEQALSQNTKYKKELAQLCAKACEDCAAECEKHDHDHCQACAEACRKCAEACKQVA